MRNVLDNSMFYLLQVNYISNHKYMYIYINVYFLKKKKQHIIYYIHIYPSLT